MPWNEQLTERYAIAVAQPTTINSGSTASINTGNGLFMGVIHRAFALCNIGAVTGGGAVTFQLQSATVSGGTFTNIGGSYVLTGITTANQPNSIEIRADQMPNGRPWLRAIVTETGGQNVLVNLELIGDESAYKPANTEINIGNSTFTNQVVVN